MCRPDPPKMFTVLTVAVVLGLLVSAAGAAVPEIAHVYPDHAGNHLFRNAPHILTGENFGQGLEIYTWVMLPEAGVIEEAARLLGTDEAPRLPEIPPLEGRETSGNRWIEAEYPHWDVIYRWDAPADHMGVHLLEVEEQVILTNLAASRGDMHTSVVWLKNQAGFSEPYLMNIAQPRWISDRTVRPGQVLRIYGPGMQMHYKESRLALRREGEVRFVSPQRQFQRDAYETHLLELTLPADLPAGEHEIYLHNGFGGPYGWVAFGHLQVEASAGEEERVFRVRDFGALGDGEREDSPAIEAAIKAASENGGGVVYFSPGVYLVREGLLVPSGVVLRGAERDNTVIRGMGFDTAVTDGRRYWDIARPSPPPVLLLQPFTSLQRLTVRGRKAPEDWRQRTVAMVEGDGKTPPLPDGAGLGRVSLQGVRIQGNFGGGQRVGSPAWGIEVVNCVFEGSLDFSAPTTRADVIDNTFSGGSMAFSGGLYDSFVDGNVMRHGPERLFFLFPAHNNYIRRNEIYNFGTRGQGTEGTAEAYLLHGGSHKASGRVSEAGAGTLTDVRQSWLPDQFSRGRTWHINGRSTVLITAGRGFGQWRHVVSNTDNTLALDRPWRVMPDESSEYVVGNFFVDNTLYDNYLDGLGFLMLGYDQVNTLVEKQRHLLAGPLDLRGFDYDGGSPAWYNMLLNNQVEGSYVRIDAQEMKVRPFSGPQLFGNFIVGNNIVRPAERAPGMGSLNRPMPGLDFTAWYRGHAPTGRSSHTIIVANRISHAAGGIRIPEWVRKTTVLNNDFIMVESPILDQGSGTLQQGNMVYSLCELSGRDVKEPLPDIRRPDPLAGQDKPVPVYRYLQQGESQSQAAHRSEWLRVIIPAYTHIPADIESEEVQGACADNLKELYGILQEHEARHGRLPRAAFYPERPLTDADSLLLLLGESARPFLRCPAAGPDFDALGWPGYIWNDELSGRKLSEVEDSGETWLLMDFVAPHVWQVANRFGGHRGGVNVLFADGRVEWLAAAEVGERWPFK